MRDNTSQESKHAREAVLAHFGGLPCHGFDTVTCLSRRVWCIVANANPAGIYERVLYGGSASERCEFAEPQGERGQHQQIKES
jgi:hypothetical protein